MMKRFSVMRAASAAMVLGTLAGGLLATEVSAAGGGPEFERHKWTFGGIRGYFDNAQLQRGFLVYKEVCASCHGLKRLYFRNLAERSGPGFNEDGVKSLAADWPNRIAEPNEAGEIADRRGNIITRAPRLSDPILGPYANEAAARAANNGALPPDLSIMALARGIEVERPFYAVPGAMVRDIATGYQEAGPDYMYALLTGYKDVPLYTADAAGKLTRVPSGQKPAGAKACASVEDGGAGKPDVCNALQTGMHYNSHFAGHQIAMAAPLSNGIVKYPKPQPNDGKTATPETVAQYAEDVSAFLAWAADPKLEERKRIGLLAMLYLLVTAVLLFFAKKRVWSQIPH